MSMLKLLQRLLSKFWHSLLRGKRLPVYSGLLVTYLVFMLFNSNNATIDSLRQRLDNVIYDTRFNIVKPTLRSNEHNIVIVDYDQKSLEKEGQWPWSRYKIGELVNKLADYGVLVVGFDVFFPEYERNLFSELDNRIALNPEYAATLEKLLPQLEAEKQSIRDLLDGDRAFAEAMASVDTVLGFSFRPNEGVRSGVLPKPIFKISAKNSSLISLSNMQGYVGNVDTLQNGAQGAGFFDTQPDIDGIIRASPLIMQFQNNIYPSLPLEMARLYFFEDEFSADIETDLSGNISELQGIFMGGVRIPTDEHGKVLVPYIGVSHSFPYISATDILRGDLTAQEEELLFNSLVLVGTTSTGLYDLRATPVQEVYPGVEIHANILNAILSSSKALVVQGDTTASDSKDTNAISNMISVLDEGLLSPFPRRPDWETGVIRIAILVIGIGLALIYPYLGPTLLGISSATFLLGLTVLNFQLWSRYNLDFSLVILWVLIALITILNMMYGFLKEGFSKRAIKGMFDQYVPPAHIDAMLNNPDKYNFDGESKELSVLFSDIRNFTSISEKLSATELKTLLNDFFTPITGIIFDHQGTIDKYVGDMVMAFWGAPLDDPDHRKHAVLAALKMLQKVEDLKPLFKQRGLPEVNIGVGINSGMMNVGDMGSTYRRSYTVLGDAVNLGSRLESITKVYGVKLLIGEQTYDSLSGILCRQVDKVQVKGKEEPIRIYQPLCPIGEASDALKMQVDAYHRALASYLKQNWDEAEILFLGLQKAEPDTQLYALYLDRIASLRNEALAPDWDGTYRHTSK